MSYLNIIKNDQSLLALVESIDAQRIQERGEFSGNKSSDPFSVDELNNTVDLDDQERGLGSDISFDPDSIELSDEDKAIVRKNLQAMLDEIEGDDISIPALEMVLAEVAQQSTYLSESDEEGLNSPVEKSEKLKAKIGAAINYSKELLELGAENGGVIPDDNAEPASEPVEDTGNNAEPDLSAEIGATEEDKEPIEENLETQAEPVVENLEEPASEDKDPIEEGVCTECGDEAVVEVDPSEVIKVVDEDEVETIDDIDGLGSEAGESAKISELSSKIDSLTDLVNKLVGTQSAVFEAAGLFGDFTNKAVEGSDPKMNNGAQHSDFQQKATPKTVSGELKLGELRTLASTPKKVAPSTQYGRENEAEAAKANSGTFKKDSRDQGKSTTAPESGYSKATSTNAPKKAPAQKTVSPEIKQAATSVLAESKAKSFLEEARRIIRSGK